MADPATAGLTLDTLFSDNSPTGMIITLSSWLYGSDIFAWLLFAFWVSMAVFPIGLVGYLSVSDAANAAKRFGPIFGRFELLLGVTICLVAPFLQPAALAWVGVQSSQPLSPVQVLGLAAANLSSKGADMAAAKLVSLNPITAPSMPLLRRQADAYFQGADQAVQAAKANVDATGGAMSGSDLNANLLHGAGAAYASAGLNNANTPPEKIKMMMEEDLDAARRMQNAWSKHPNMAMGECVGNTMLSDVATSLNNSQYATAPDDKAMTAGAWNSYYQAAAAYLTGGGASGAGVASPNFGSAWLGRDSKDPGSDVQLPPVTDALKTASGPREIVLNAEAYRSAFAPGTDPQELQQPASAIATRLAGTSDPQQRANLQRLLAAAKAKEAAQTANLRARNQATAAFENLASAMAMANIQGMDSTSDLSSILKNAQGDGAATLNDLLRKNNLAARCQAYGKQVAAVDLGMHVSDLKTRFNLWRDGTSDPTAGAKQVGSGGWLKLGVYYLSTASAYMDAFNNSNHLREAAYASAGTYFAGDPVAIQATNAGNVAMGLGASMLASGAALKIAGNVADKAGVIAGPGGMVAGKALGGVGDAVGGTLIDWGKFLVIASIFRDFAPYLAFVVVVFWWYLRLAFYVLVSPAVVVIQSLRNLAAWEISPKDLADALKRLGVFASLPLVYVCGWATIFFGTALIDVLIAATNGETGAWATAKNLATLNVEQAGMSSNIVPLIVKFVLGLIISTVLFKSEGWLDSLFIGHGTKDHDIAAPSATDIAK